MFKRYLPFFRHIFVNRYNLHRGYKMKKLNITKKHFNESKYFQDKYGKLEYVSESGEIYKTSKGQVIKFVKKSDNDEMN